MLNKNESIRIGILTFHRAYNYGAFLQCYSLMKNLKKSFPSATVEVIDYESTNMKKYYDTDVLSLIFGHTNGSQGLSVRYKISKLLRFIKKICNDRDYVKKIRMRNQIFDSEIKHMNLSPKRLISDNKTEIMNYINELDYDIIVVGSDAVWNDGQTSFVNPYYLDKIITARCVSYAASSYGMDYKVKTMEEVDIIRECINRFMYIGIRDKATEDYVRLLNEEIEPHHNCDPSIILDLNDKVFQNNNIKSKLEKAGVDFSKPIYGIMGGDWLGKIAKSLIPKEAQLVAVYDPNKYADVYLYDLSPFEWAKVFSMFIMTFTHYFHGTLFSLKNGTPTLSIELDSDYSKKYDTKIVDVLKRMDLEDFHFSKSQIDNDYQSLKIHFDDVINNMCIYKERIEKGLEEESMYYSSFIQAISEYTGVNNER